MIRTSSTTKENPRERDTEIDRGEGEGFGGIDLKGFSGSEDQISKARQ